MTGKNYRIQGYNDKCYFVTANLSSKLKRVEYYTG